MAEFRECPFRRAVALCAVGAEQAAVPVFGLVARRAVQQRFFGLQTSERRLARGGGFVKPAFDLRHIRTRALRLAFELLEADVREGDMIHFRRARHPPLMFKVASGARGDFGVEGARLALQNRLVVGVADDAVLRLDSLVRGMARGAVTFEKGVRLR